MAIDVLEPPFTPTELADFLHTKAHVLDAMRERGEGPGYIVLRGSRGGKGQVRYPREAVRRWLDRAGAGDPSSTPREALPVEAAV